MTELDNVGRQFKPHQWRPCGVAWDAVNDNLLVRGIGNFKKYVCCEVARIAASRQT